MASSSGEPINNNTVAENQSTTSSKSAQRLDLLKKDTSVFLGVIPPVFAVKIGRRLGFLSNFFANLDPQFKLNLKKLNHQHTAKEYLEIGMTSYLLLGLLLGYLVFFLSMAKENPVEKGIGLGLVIFFLVFFMLTYMSVKSVASKLKEKSILIEKNLMYALKDMVLTAKSGGHLYEGMVGVADTDYGEVSVEFDIVVRKINVGIPFTDAIDEMVDRNTSDYLKKTGWRLINTYKTGSDIEVALSPIINELENNQRNKIENYAKELNLWSLVFMMFSVAIPTIGSTMMIVMSAFSQGGTTPGTFIGFGVVCLIIQFGITAFVKGRRPNVQF
jgi:pilus assembly protein TadC